MDELQGSLTGQWGNGMKKPPLEGDTLKRVVMTMKTVTHGLRTSHKLQRLQKLTDGVERKRQMQSCAQKFFREVQTMLDWMPDKNTVSSRAIFDKQWVFQHL